MLHSAGTQVGDDFLQPPNLKEMLHIPKWLDIGQGTSHPCLLKRFHRLTFSVKTCYDFFLGSATANLQETTSSGGTWTPQEHKCMDCRLKKPAPEVLSKP